MNLERDQDPGQFIRDWSQAARDRWWAPPGAQSSLEADQDMLDAINDHAIEDCTIVVATHGGVTIDLLRSIVGENCLASRATELVASGIPGGAVTRLDKIADDWVVENIASVDHIAFSDRTGALG